MNPRLERPKEGKVHGLKDMYRVGNEVHQLDVVVLAQLCRIIGLVRRAVVRQKKARCSILPTRALLSLTLGMKVSRSQAMKMTCVM